MLTVLISIILYAHGEAARDMLVAFGRRLAGDNGERVVLLAGASIRAVALGVVGTALVQTVLAGIGLAAAGIPLAGFLTALVLLFCIAQVGPMVVLVPAVIWLFWNERTGWAYIRMHLPVTGCTPSSPTTATTSGDWAPC